MPFEYATTGWGTKQFRGVTVETYQVDLGGGYDGGDWSAQLVYNFVENPLQKGGELFPVRLDIAAQVLERYEVNASTNIDTHTLHVDYDTGPFTVSAGVSFGFHKLEHPAPAYLLDEASGTMYGRADAPDPLYNLTLEWNF